MSYQRDDGSGCFWVLVAAFVACIVIGLFREMAREIWPEWFR